MAHHSKIFIKAIHINLVKGNPKAPFSIATTPRCWEGCYFIPWIAPFYP